MGRITIDDIQLFMSSERDATFIEDLSGKYSLKDFIKVDRGVERYLKNKMPEFNDTIYGCILDNKNGSFCLNIDSVEQRLINEYFDFLFESIKKYRDASVQYIIAYHYIALIQQQAFQLSVRPDAPFHILGDTITPLGELNYDKYLEVKYGKYHELIPYICKEDIKKFNKFFYDYGYNYHAAKHFSLLEYFLKSERIYGSYELKNEFEMILDTFVYRYRAILTHERIHVYMTMETRKRIMESLDELRF